MILLNNVFNIILFLLLMLIAHFTSKKSQSNSYFDGDKSSPWFLVAFGMIGSGISAVSLVSIPGNVGNENWHYFQFILGTLVGYLFIAFVFIVYSRILHVILPPVTFTTQSRSVTAPGLH